MDGRTEVWGTAGRRLRDLQGSRWAAAGRGLGRVLRDKFPLTMRGLGLGLSAAAGLRFLGYGELDQVWYVTGLGLLALVCLTLALVVCAACWSAFGPDRTRRNLAVRPPAYLDTRAPFATGYRRSRLRFWPLVEVRLSVVDPAHVRADSTPAGPFAEEALTVDDHGELRTLVRSLELRDVFGLCAVTLRERGDVEINVLPHVGALRSLPMLRSLSGGDDLPHPLGLLAGDRLDMRRYAAGDPARFIHWKVYARTQRLVVRVPERALSRAHRVAAYLVAGTYDGASAAVARVALEERAFGDDFRFGADGANVATDRTPEALAILCRSAHARERGGQGLTTFLGRVEREGPVALLLFVPAKLGAEFSVLHAVVAQRPRPPRVVIGVDGIEAVSKGPLWRRAALLPEPKVRISATTLAQTVAAYRRLGAEVLIFDRETGRTLSEAHFAQPAREAA